MNKAVQRAAVDAEKMELDAIVFRRPDKMNELVETKQIVPGDLQENKPVVPDVKKAMALKKLPRPKPQQPPTM